MCSLPTAVGTGLSIVGGFLGNRSQVAALQAQYDAQRKAAITQMNYQLQNYEQNRTDAFDSAINELVQIRSQQQKLNGSVKAAIAENISGRTADMIERNAEGDVARVYASVQDNYDRKSNEIDLNKEATLRNTKAYVNNIGATAQANTPSKATPWINALAQTLGAYTTVEKQKASYIGQGLLGDDSNNYYDFWTGRVKTKQGLKIRR